ncbi:MAG: hypothetical protein ACOZJX_19080 [Pseudomonadota bacterium]
MSKSILRSLIPAIALTALAAAAGTAQAQATTAWTDWTKETTTTMGGRLMLASGAVTVKFSGPQIYFNQLGEANDRDYWTSGSPDPYAVTGRPTGSDIIGFTGGTGTTKYKITFSRPVTDPVIAILSLGRSGIPAKYTFVQTPTLVSSGIGYYGGCAECLVVNKRSVVGTEGHGVVRFVGTYQTISWTQPDYENWHGIQVGAPQAQ